MADTYATARAMVADLRAKRVSARELLDAHLARNDRLARLLNAVVDVDIVRAVRDAEAVDVARARGQALGPLAGIPMTIKDGFDVENMPAVAGNPAFKAREKSCADAVVVERVRSAGGTIWGKTNVPFMLSDLQSYNAVYGTTNNPYDVTRGPGGSSGGAAAALAAGITPLEIGSDIGGSLRHPANFCGVVALKPTWGALSMRGSCPPGPDCFVELEMAVVGPMARTVDDVKMLWSVLRGTPEAPRRGVAGARVAIWDEEASWPLAREVKAAVARAGEALAASGASVERAKPKIDGADLMDYYYLMLTALLSSGLPEPVLAAYADMRPADKELAARGGAGAGAAADRLRATASFREVMCAQVKQQRDKDRLAEFLARYDAIVMPISTVTAFPHQQEPEFHDRVLDVDGNQVPYESLLNWISPATVLHVPSIAVPAGRAANGLPVGVQIIGRWQGEERLLDFAAAVEEALGGFRPPTGL